MSGRWRDTAPAELRAWLADVAAPWWIAGGWALELWLGRPTRPHCDIEIGCFRSDLDSLLAPLGGWTIALARNKELMPLIVGEPLPEPPFSLWVRRPDQPLWDFEVLAEEQEAGRWVYRRDRRISRPRDELMTTTVAGWRVIVPEVQLLYKSKAPRPKDEWDFDLILPHLGHDRRLWLREALAVSDPSHPWMRRLAE